MTKNKYLSATICVLVVFIMVGILTFFFAPTHDDLIDLNCKSFAGAFEKALFYGNGRFLGNMFVAVFLNNDILDSLFRTIVIVGIVVLSAVVTNGYKTSAILLSSFLYLGISIPIFRQSYVWGHGFYNYVPPVFCLLVVLALTKWCIKNNKSKLYYGSIPIVFLVSFAAQLFSENCSTINGLICLLILCWAYKSKRWISVSVAALAGSVFGAVCMFVGPTLLGAGDRLDEYRSVSTGLWGIITTAARNAFEILNTISASWGICLAVSAIIFLSMKSKGLHICWVYKAVVAIFPIFAAIQGLNNFSVIKLAFDLGFLVYIACVAVVFCKLFDRKVLLRILIFLSIAILSVLQLLVVSPIGPRCMFVTVSILSVGVLYVFSIINDEDSKLVEKYINGMACLTIVLYAVLLIIYMKAFSVHRVRMEYGFEQLKAGNKQIEIIELPYEAMFHCPNESYVYYYTFNHGDKDEMSFAYITYEEYLK